MTVKRLKELLRQVPDDATVNVYEGEDIGILIEYSKKSWWIRTADDGDEYTEGFDE